MTRVKSLMFSAIGFVISLVALGFFASIGLAVLGMLAAFGLVAGIVTLALGAMEAKRDIRDA